MKSWWDMTKAEQDARMAIESLSLGAVSETFRHPASYAEIRLVKTIWKYADEANAAKKLAAELEHERDAYRSMLCDVVAAASPNGRDHPTMFPAWEKARALLKDGPPPMPLAGDSPKGGG